MGGHVDGSHRCGTPRFEEWNCFCKRVDEAYKWGMAITNEYGHAGTDLKITRDRDGDQVITVNQQYYIDMLMLLLLFSDIET